MARPQRRLRQLLQFDRKLQLQHSLHPGVIAGLDEVGRGPLAGPVVASAVLLKETRFTVPIDDSKRLTASARERAYREILPSAKIGVGFVLPQEIDRVGIQTACHLAMLRALERLPAACKLALVDGPWVPPGCPIQAVPIVDGDFKSLRIACASIVAKVIRDRWMTWIHLLHPEYGFHRHKGYGTEEHRNTLRLIGPSLFHRFTFRPIRWEGDPERSNE